MTAHPLNFDRSWRVPANAVPVRALPTPIAAWRRNLSRLKNDGTVLVYVPIAILLFFMLVWPLVMLTIGAFSTTSPLAGAGEWTLSGFTDMWREINQSHALRNSLVYAALTTVLATSIALGL